MHGYSGHIGVLSRTTTTLMGNKGIYFRTHGQHSFCQDTYGLYLGRRAVHSGHVRFVFQDTS
jgi:hypothetical protein